MQGETMVLTAAQWDIFLHVLTVGIVTVATAGIINHVLARSFAKAHEAVKKHSSFIAERFNNVDKDKIKFRLARDKTRLSLIRRMIVTTIYIVGIVFIIGSIPALRAFSYSLLAGAGVAAIIIGFATQKTMANVISGIMIAISQPFKIGDRMNFKGEYGIVEDITLRHTVLRTWDNRHLIIPNAMMNDETVQNYSFEDEKILSTVEFLISFDSDLDKARKIIQSEIKGHKFFKDLKKGSEFMSSKDSVNVRVVELADNGLRLKGYYWVDNQPRAFKSACDIRESVFRRFVKEGIEIPYPYRTIVDKRRKR